MFLKDMKDAWRESGVLAEIGTEILLDEGAVINAAPMQSGACRERTIFMNEVRCDGIDL